MGASTSTKPVDVSALSQAELEAALAAIKTKTADERASLAEPFLTSIYPTLVFADSANDKPWHGATFTTTLTAPDGRKVRLNVTATDVEASARLKKAASASE